MSLNDTITALGTSIINLVNKKVANGEDGINVANYGAVADANYYNADDGKWYTSSAKTTEATDNYEAITAAITDAKSQGKLLIIKGKYRSSQDIVIDGMKGVIGDGGIVGCTCAFSRCQPFKTEGFLYFDELMVCGSFLSVYDKLYVYGNIVFKGNGYNNERYGFFWNKFNSIECHGKMLFDCDGGHSINQNIFENVRVWGGIHIKGTTTTNPHGCNSNIFINLDTSGANITASDGTDGYQVLNESISDGYNIIQNWYAENNRGAIKGKWHIYGIMHQGISGNFQKNNSLELDRTSSVLANIATDTRITNDFMAGATNNKLLGGNWKYLGHNGLPLGILYRNVAHKVIGVDDAPDGNPLALEGIAASGWAGISIVVPTTSHNKVALCAYCKIKNAPNAYTLIARDTGSFYTNASMTPVGGDWYLMRLTGITKTYETRNNIYTGELIGDGITSNDNYNNHIFSSKYTHFLINLTTTDYDASAVNKPTIILGSIFVTTEQTCFLPQFEQGPKEARATAIPDGGIWKIGDKCFNSVPTVGQPYGWICTTSGDCRTLSGVTGSVESGTATLEVNDTSDLYIGANINITGVTGNKLITNISENTITLDSNADATVTDATISFVSPVWASMGNLE